MVDKLVIGNGKALTAKYGSVGRTAVESALKGLVAADGARGIATQVLLIDDPAQMATVGGNPVAGPADERGAKAAVDDAFGALSPDYILLLDGPDVVPHITLDAIPGLSDGDLNIPSDLPFASPASWGPNASDFLSVTRAVGRLPATPSAGSSDGIVALIAAAAAHSPGDTAGFTPPFAISATVWSGSTQLSVANVFGPGMTVVLAPPATHPAIDVDLRRRAHFINCHGAQASDEFYGQQGSSYPMAMSSLGTAPHISRGTVAAAECCYGAELFDYTQVGTAQPICMAYLSAGAAAFLGSTNIAYGPTAGNAQADLLTQYFLKYVLSGASSGRSCLQARQEFIRTQQMSSPANLKTLAQFVLLGDPACQPCLGGGVGQIGAACKSFDATESAEVIDWAFERKNRRVALQSEGAAIETAATRPGSETSVPLPLLQQLRRVATERGIASDIVTVLQVTGGELYLEAVKGLGTSRKVATIVDVRGRTSERPGPFVKLLTAYIQDDRIVRAELSESR